MNKLTRITAALLLALALAPGCVPKGYIRAESLKPTLESALERHDHYVTTDEDLSALERRIHLRDSEVLRLAFDEATKEAAAEEEDQ